MNYKSGSFSINIVPDEKPEKNYVSSCSLIKIKSFDENPFKNVFIEKNLWFSDVFRGIKREHWEEKD